MLRLDVTLSQMILNKTTIILSVMEIFIFVWKTSKQAVTDTQNQNLHSNESFLIKKNNSHSSSLKENWAHLLQVLGAWGVGFYYFIFFYISHSSLFSKVFATLGQQCCTKSRNTSTKPNHFICLQNFPQNEQNTGGSPSIYSPTTAFLGEYTTET